MSLCKYVNVMFLFVKLLLVLPETVYTLSRNKASIYPKRNLLSMFNGVIIVQRRQEGSRKKDRNCLIKRMDHSSRLTDTC